ncbi:MAG: hypothetical protein ACFE8A_12595 [Candidatus Hodarchaeota archaeon]
MKRCLIIELSELSPFDIIQGSFSLTFVVISIILGIIIISKYFKVKTRDYILLGIGMIGMSNPWLPDAISFLMIIFLNSNLWPEISFIIGYAFLPFVVLCWLMAFTNLYYEEKQKITLIIFSIPFSILEIFFFYLLFTDSTLIGTFVGPFQIRWALFMNLFLLCLIAIVIITGILFTSQSIKSDNLEVKIKGKFLFVAFISFTIAAIIESLFHLDPVTVVITRSILISSAIEFYIGFILPKWIRNFFPSLSSKE